MTNYTIEQIRKNGFIDIIDYTNHLTWGSKFKQMLDEKEYTFIVIDKYYKEYKHYARITLLDN